MLKFELDEFCWVAKTRLSSWAGFQERLGMYGAISAEHPSDGTLTITFAPEGRETEPLKEEEIKLIDWLLENHEEQANAVTAAILAEYPTIRRSYLDAYGDEDVDDILPEISSVDELKKLIGLYNVNIHQVSKNSIPYVGYEFGCAWDDEHGLGILIHEKRMIKVGYADTAFLLWIAENDAENSR